MTKMVNDLVEENKRLHSEILLLNQQISGHKGAYKVLLDKFQDSERQRNDVKVAKSSLGQKYNDVFHENKELRKRQEAFEKEAFKYEEKFMAYRKAVRVTKGLAESIVDICSDGQ